MSKKVLITVASHISTLNWIYFQTDQTAINFCNDYNSFARNAGAPAFAVVVPDDREASDG